MTAVSDNALKLLGLARRGGNLAAGEESVAEVCSAKKARAVFLACDAGDTISRRARRMTETGGMPLVETAWTKAELGECLGRSSCAVAALTDQGLACAAVSRLAEQDESLAELARSMTEKLERMKSRAKKKPNPKTGHRPGKG